jgi:hypothetical protein
MINTHKELFSKNLEKKKYIKVPRRDIEVWGPHYWFLIYSHALNFTPESPVCFEDTRTLAKKYYEMYSNIIPCNKCRSLYREYCKNHPLTDDMFQTKHGFFKWTLSAHNHLNKSIGLDEVSFENALEFWKTYEEDKPNKSYVPKSRQALLVGINYPGCDTTDGERCRKDAAALKHCLIQRYGYEEDNITILTGADDPKKEAIMQSLSELVIDTWNDDLDEVFIFVGSYSPQVQNGKKKGKYVLPCDFEKNGSISNRSLIHLLSKMNPNTKVSCFFDVSNSGDILMLPFNYTMQGEEMKLSTSSHRHGFNSKIICMSSCADDQTASGTGAQCLIRALMNGTNDTAKNILQTFNKFTLSENSNQTPVLSTTRTEIDHHDETFLKAKK